MISLRNLLLTASLLVLSGCTMYDTYSEVEALNAAQPVGSPFTQGLANEYKQYANTELKDMFDYPDALHFARKGLAAASGETVMPEPVDDWNLSKEHIKELSASRGRLIVAFDLGGREIAPATAAKAQVKYDCWIEQQEENWESTEATGCKDGFLSAIAELEGLVQQAPQQTARPAPAPMDAAEPMSAEEAMYLVFFNWDASDLSSGAKSVIEAVAKEVKNNPPNQISISGHADTSGDDEYNKRLGLKRASSVRDELVRLGISPNLLVVESRGESELLVATPNDVREPANRRVNISFK
jgi:OmpA-OmpF porin, OOP family